MKLVRSVPWFVFAAVLAACGDSATSPRSSARSISVASTGGGSTADLIPGDTLQFTITLDPGQSETFNLGNGHTVYFPNGSECDPNKSSYGIGTWDSPCPPLNFPVVEHVRAWVDSTGNPYEDFSPAIRFMPTANPAKFVILSLTDPTAAVNPLMNINWCPTTSSPCINEALSDSTELTQHDPVSGRVWRRIKHFSGYNVAAGDDSDALFESVSSGFMMASGRDSGK